jgi:hypothetical protein
MPNQLRTKLVTLASRASDKELSNLEAILLEISVQKLERPDKAKVRKVIAGSIGKEESGVITKLASHDDSDRILDDIVNILNDED